MNNREGLSVGTTLGGITILALLDAGRYRVRYACCGRAGILTRKQIITRLHRPQTQCHACGCRRRRAASRFIQHDDLPVHPGDQPPSAAWLLAIYARAEAVVRRRALD
ncbi:hypothetical protein HW932_03355 [Allochromatium humboldtianum]|uniref:Uncharacterized protein n=1 Tax=Allochromatium humboldtianum TaxID=504901 RepID=A0A850RGR9_9GAMM|nr:hypothetical protein [Allochromatium humboldtianum]NVZ08293.1 hypothetical protein [Allochromatium humboldtianum]